MAFEDRDGFSSVTADNPLFGVVGAGLVDGHTVEGLIDTTLIGPGGDVMISEGEAIVSGDASWFIDILAD